MKFWFDTEFIEDGKTIDLISIGAVAEDGRTYYAENAECALGLATDWVKQNVIVHLQGESAWRSRAQMARDLIEFMGDKPEIWAYYADYDWVALCQLFGTMMDLPKGWPMYCRDVKQLCDSLGNPKLPDQDTAEHHALADAQWTRIAWKFLNARPEEAIREAALEDVLVALRKRWKEYRDASVSVTGYSTMEQMAFGGRAGGILEAIDLLKSKSAHSPAPRVDDATMREMIEAVKQRPRASMIEDFLSPAEALAFGRALMERK